MVEVCNILIKIKDLYCVRKINEKNTKYDIELIYPNNRIQIREPNFGYFTFINELQKIINCTDKM